MRIIEAIATFHSSKEIHSHPVPEIDCPIVNASIGYMNQQTESNQP
jgi:hypothetical protein